MATLVLGGARSGKSAHAEGLLPADEAIYVATGRADPADDEWTVRIAAHRSRRPAGWRTVELADPRGLAPLVSAAEPGPLLVDDLATWLTALLDDTGGWDGDVTPALDECARLVDAVAATRAGLVLVSAEVGLGVVPATRSGRLFRDRLGALNADLARVCTEVVLLVAGIPLRLR